MEYLAEMAETLKPCPFCGELPQVAGGTAMHACRVLDREMRVLVAAWNRRAERTCCMVDNGCEFCCSECDWHCGYDDEPNYCPNCGAKVVE